MDILTFNIMTRNEELIESTKDGLRKRTRKWKKQKIEADTFS